MQEVQGGSEKAYVELLDGIGRLIIKMIRAKIKDNEIAEDLYQNVLMTLHRARHTYDPSRPFRPWLYSVTRNTIYDYLRKNRRRIELEILVGEHLDFKTQSETAVEDSHLLDKALSQLPEKQREAVLLLKIEGLSLEEAAKKAGVTVSAIKVRAHRGYKAIKNYLIHDAKKELA